jgi:hypothetical protein
MTLVVKCKRKGLWRVKCEQKIKIIIKKAYVNNKKKKKLKKNQKLKCKKKKKNQKPKT